jgi:hypothetical protein
MPPRRPRPPDRDAEIRALVTTEYRAVEGIGRVPAYTLAINPGFAPPNAIEQRRGVEPHARERTQAEHAIAQYTLEALVPASVLGMRRLILRLEDRYTKRGLEDALVAIAPIPPRRHPERPLPKSAHNSEAQAFRLSLRRALARSGPGVRPNRAEIHDKQGLTQPEYRRRLQLFMVQHAALAANVYGLWEVELPRGETDEHFSWAYTSAQEPDELEAVRALILAGGVGLVALVEEIVHTKKQFGGYDAHLLQLNGIQTQVHSEG